MPKLDRSGPEGIGSKTGRKLGKCKKNKSELKEQGTLGKGLGKRRHSNTETNTEGKGDRNKYNQNI